MEIIWTDRARNEEESLSVKRDRNSLHTIKKKKSKMDWYQLVQERLLKRTVGGTIKKRDEVNGRQ